MLIIIQNWVVEIKKLVMNHESRPVKSNFGISSVFQKLLKYFNGTTVSNSFSVLLPSNVHVMLVLQSKDFEPVME